MYTVDPYQWEIQINF